METLKKHVPYSWQEGIEELGRIAISFEELIFNTALNQVLLTSLFFILILANISESSGMTAVKISWLGMVCFEFQVDYFCKISLKMQTMEEDNYFLVFYYMMICRLELTCIHI